MGNNDKQCPKNAAVVSLIFVEVYMPVKEQQAQIEAGQKEIRDLQESVDRQTQLIKRQQAELDALKAVVCITNPSVLLCNAQK